MKAKKVREELFAKWKSEIESEKLAVFMVYECYLLWGYLLSYAWLRTDKQIETPLKNERERQTYYGALDYKTKEFIVQELKKSKY